MTDTLDQKRLAEGRRDAERKSAIVEAAARDTAAAVEREPLGVEGAARAGEFYVDTLPERSGSFLEAALSRAKSVIHR